MPSRGPAMDYMSADFGAASSSRFPFRVQINRQTNRKTNIQTDPTERSTPRRRLYSRRG